MRVSSGLIRLPVLGAILALAGCGGGGTASPPEYPATDTEVAQPIEQTSTGTGQEPMQPTEPPAPPVQVVAADHTPIEGRTPTVRIQAPRNNQTIRTGDVNLRLQVRNWELGPEPGNHVHVIVDNEPYIAVRDVRRPINLNALVRDNLGHELEPGTHVVRVFPSRPHHESVKDPGAFATVTFNYQQATEGFELDAAAPLLTFSRPKGCNPAGERILLDFFVTNVDALAAGGTRVHYAIDNRVQGDIVEWKPHYIENLQPGEHQIRLSLVDGDGQPIAGMFNDTTRQFTVQAQCPEAHHAEPAEAEHGAQGAGGRAGAPGQQRTETGRAGAPGQTGNTPGQQQAPGQQPQAPAQGQGAGQQQAPGQQGAQPGRGQGRQQAPGQQQ